MRLIPTPNGGWKCLDCGLDQLMTLVEVHEYDPANPMPAPGWWKDDKGSWFPPMSGSPKTDNHINLDHLIELSPPAPDDPPRVMVDLESGAAMDMSAKKCIVCKGTGKDPFITLNKCPECKGSGYSPFPY